MKAKDLIQRFEQFAPRYLAEAGDPIGVQIGDTEKVVHRVLVTLDVRPKVVQEAIQMRAEMIFAHHPAMFRKIQNLDYRDPQKKMYGDIAAHGIVVYAAHTNLDSATGGMNDWLAAALGLTDVQLLVPGYSQKFKQLTVARLAGDSIDQSLLEQYQSSILTTSDNSHWQLQVPQQNLSALVTALKELLPSDTSFISADLPGATQQYGLGRVGNLAQPQTVHDFAVFCKSAFGVAGLRLISQHPDQLIKRVAVLGGDGGKFYHQALAAGADAYVTGDVYYHTAHDMLASGLTVIDPGHHIESICKPQLTALFKQWAKNEAWNVQVQASAINTDPFTFI